MQQTGVGFAPPCMQFGMPAAMCQGMEDGQGGAEPTLEIVDRVLIPADLPAGEYVLGWYVSLSLSLSLSLLALVQI